MVGSNKMEFDYNPIKIPKTYLFFILFAFVAHFVIGCQDSPVGIEYRNIIPDDRFTSTSHYDSYYFPKNARLNGATAWGPATKYNSNDYLQIDLGQVFVICAVATQGCGPGCTSNEWVEQYKISTSVNNVNWRTYKLGNVDRLFPGNTDTNTVVKNVLDYPVLLRFIRFIPTRLDMWKALRVEAYGIEKRCQDSPVGIADSNIIPDDRFTASSYYGSASGDTRYVPKNARLNGTAGWGPKTTTNPNDYLQIDLGQVYAICAVATQGYGTHNSNEWTTEYEISTSLNKVNWTTITLTYTICSSKLFPGNTDYNNIVKNSLDSPGLVRFIKFIPTRYFNWKILRVEVYGIKKHFPCRSIPVGVSSGKIPDSNMTSSSSYNSTTSPSKARLNYKVGLSWCSATSDSSSYLQVNLGSPYIICGIATQGDHMTDQWVQSYNMLTSNDGSTFTKYMENGQVKTFVGNFDPNTTVKNLLYDGTVTQYIRVAPKSHYGSTNCMRTELYGIKQDGGCTAMFVGLSHPSIIPDHRFAASSSYGGDYLPNNARLNGHRKAWAPKTTSSGDWLQVDLGSVVFVCAVATQGAGDLANEWTKSYKIRVSLDNVNWNYYQENNIDKIFTGNINKKQVVTNSLRHPITTKSVRFYPVTFANRPSMRVEVYGISSGCQDSPVGIADSNIIPVDRFNASSYYGSASGDTRYEPNNARLNGAIGRGWGPRTNAGNDYLQIDLVQVFVICAVATQGCNGCDEWTTQYKISTSVDNNTWTTYKTGITEKLFPGNTDSNTVVKNVLGYPVLVRYVRYIPTTYNNWKVLRVEAYSVRRGLLCSSLPVGIGSGKIPDSDMTSSSSYNVTTSPSKARLNYTAGSSWCAATSDSSPYLQINLGSPYIICGIATQGDHMTDQWVQSYNILTSNDGSTFTTYMENSQVKSFSGNFDSNAAVKNLLYDGTVSQYIRVAPTSHYGSTNCMRTELYGIKHDGGCTNMFVGLSYSSIIPDHRFTASSHFSSRYLPMFARLLTSKGWTPSTQNGGDWLQIDLGSVVFVCAVATQGSGHGSAEWMKSYKLKVSLDNVNWHYYQENNNNKTFTGNTNKGDVVTNSLAHPIKAKFIRFYPITFNGWPSTRVEVYGISSACTYPVGLEVHGVIQDSQMTSSSSFDSSHTASHGRLYGNSAWCSSTSSNTEYIQINLGQVMTVTGIATQGDHTMVKWVTTYTISYSMDSNLWNTYKAGGNSDKTFQGNSDEESVRVQWLSHPVTSQLVRVTPQTWTTAICMRIELYGCDYANRPLISGLANQNLTAASNSYVDLVCIVQEPLIQYIKWYTGNTDITSQSTGLVRGDHGVKQSTLRVNYTSDADIVSTFSCFKLAWESCYKPFFCRAMYGKTQTELDGVKGFGVRVGVAPSVPLGLHPKQIPPTANARPQLQLTWDVPAVPNGIIRKYIVTYGLNEVISELKVDGDCTTLNIPVLGGKDYWFRVKGVIVKEGDYTPKLHVSINVYKPSVPPRGLSASKKDSSTFVLSWLPMLLEKANGPIEKYEVKWTKIAIDGSSSKPTIIRKVVNVSSVHVSETTLENLGECSRYDVSIRGYTAAGPGPYSQPIKLFTTAPGAPQQLSIHDTAEKREVVLQWKEPSALEQIEKYAITLLGTKTYNNTFLHSEERDSTNSLEKFQADNLYPDTNYKFQVSAITRCGRGEKSSAVLATTKIAAPPAPFANASIVNLTSPNVKITLWPASNINGQISKYQVIVKEMVRSPSFDATRLKDYETAKGNGLNYYITAEFRADTLLDNLEFVLGDGKRYGKFNNVKLDENKMYEIAERALTGETQVLFGPMSVIARSHLAEDGSKGSNKGSRLDSAKSDRTTLYIIFAITAGTLGLIIIILLIYNRKLRRQNRNLKVCQRISSRPKTRDVEFEARCALH